MSRAIDTRRLERRAAAAGNARAEATARAIAVRIEAALPGVTVTQDLGGTIARLRLQGRGLAARAADDVRLRAPEAWRP